MRIRSVLVLLVPLVLVAAGCKSKAGATGVRLAGPSAVALFYGYSLRSPTVVHPYVAVAASRGDEIRLIDAIDDHVVLAPTVVTPLSVPVDARPSLLASGSLNDSDPADPADPGKVLTRPWLLASASTGMVARPSPLPGEPTVASRIQVVATWTAATVVDSNVVRNMTIDLAEVPGVEDAVILSMAVAPKPIPDGNGGWMAKPGEARLLVGLSGGRLMVVEFARDVTDKKTINRGTADLPAPVIQTLGFEPVSLAVAPDLVHLYVATPDPVGTVEGVAELDTSLPPGGWPVRGLDARAPTTHVVAGLVAEFAGFRTDTLLPGTTPHPWLASPTNSDLFTAPALRVYAALDRTRCGRSARVACGIAVIDPVLGGLLPDPAVPPTSVSITPKQRYLSPIEVAGTVLDMVLVMPPLEPPSDVAGNPPITPPLPPMMVVAPGSGRRLTSAVLAVASSDGRIYVADVGHWAVPSDVSIISTFSQSSATTRTQVLHVVNSLPYAGYNSDGTPIYQPDNVPFVALWSDSDLPLSYTNPKNDQQVAGYGLVPNYLYDTQGMVLHPHVTPGYTQGELWDITFEGKLPGLDRRAGQVLLSSTPIAGTNQFLTTGWAAVQDESGLPGADRFRSVTRLYDPALAIRVGDVVEITPVDSSNTTCGTTVPGTFELEVADLLYPTADYPGGALQLTNRTCRDALGAVVDCPGHPECLGTSVAAAAVTVRAGSLVMIGSGTGYAGRPPIVSDPFNDPLFRFEYEDEDALSCPMLDADATWPPAPCDATCRSTCERLLLARKARRFYYVTSSMVCEGWDQPHQQMCFDIWRNLEWPITTGPVLAFRVGLNNHAGNPDNTDNNASHLPYTARGAVLQITTTSGVSPMYRVPRSGTVPSGAVLPTGLVSFDRSAITRLADDGVRIYASYPASAVLDFSPAGGITDVTTIR